MSNSKKAELKALCLELATENSKHQPSGVLKLAKEYWDFISPTGLVKELTEEKNNAALTH